MARLGISRNRDLSRSRKRRRAHNRSRRTALGAGAAADSGRRRDCRAGQQQRIEKSATGARPFTPKPLDRKSYRHANRSCYCGHLASGSKLINVDAGADGTIGRRYGLLDALWHA